MSATLQDELADFIRAYEKANNSHLWSNVRPFITHNASYWFTDGSFSGIDEIRGAIESTFSKIQDEIYTISDLQWPIVSDSSAVCTYKFHWNGIVEGVQRSGSGRGTNVLVNSGDVWQIVHEHLST